MIQSIYRYNSLRSKLILISFLLFVSNVSVNPQVSLDKKIEQKVLLGLNLFYNFNFAEGEKLFQELIEEFPGNPAGYHFKSVINLWIYLDNRDEQQLQKFLNQSDSAIYKAQKILEADTTSPFINYLIGSAFSYRALAFARAEEYLNSLWATKEFHSYLSTAIKLDSTYYDAYLGLGLYNFAVSQTPPAWKWALELTGISGNKKLGIEYIKTAEEKGQFSKHEAGFYNSQLLAEFLLEYDSAEKKLVSLIKKFPGNLLFRYALGSLLAKQYKLEEAKHTFEKIVDSNDSLFTQLKTYSILSLGDIFFTKNNFDTAGVFYETFLDSVKDNHFNGIAALRLGLCYSFLELPDSASYFFEFSSSGNMDLDEDVYAKVKGQRYLDDPPDSVELKLIMIKNILESGEFITAIDLIDSLFSKLSTDSLRAEATLYLSKANYYLGNYKLSEQYAIDALNIESSEKWIKPFACYYAALSSQQLGNLVDAELFLEYANNYNDYFYENKLKNYLYALSYQLQRE